MTASMHSSPLLRAVTPRSDCHMGGALAAPPRSVSELRLARIERLYRALNGTVEAIMRAPSLAELFDSVCEASVNASEFVAASPGKCALGGGPAAGARRANAWACSSTKRARSASSTTTWSRCCSA